MKIKRKPVIFILTALFTPILVFFACKEDIADLPKSTESVMLKGSNTELDLVSRLIGAFSQQSNTMTNFELSGGGSNQGIDDLIHGNIDIANASRLMNEEEYAVAEEHGISPVQAIIAMDAVAIITHPRLGVDSLSLDHLSAIFSGKILNWKEVGGPDLPIKIYGRDDHSGTHTFIKRKLLGEQPITEYFSLPDPLTVLEAVKNEPAGIGYVDIGSIIDENRKPNGRIWAMNLYIDGQKAHSPYEYLAVVSGEYPLTRPLVQYFKEFPEGATLDLLKFELSQEGQQIVRNFGYFPITETHKQINRIQGILFE